MPLIAGVNVVRSRSEARALLDRVWRQNKEGIPASVDTEFGRDEKNREYVTVWSLSTGKGDRNCIYADPGLDVFRDWIEDEAAIKVFHTYVADADSLSDSGVVPQGLYADIWVMSAIADSHDHRHDLKYLEHKYLGGPIRAGFKETFSYVPDGKKKPVLHTWPEIMASKELRQRFSCYSAADAEGTIRVFKKLKYELNKDDWNYFETYRKIDVPFTLTLHAMMKRGFLVDRKVLQAMEKEYIVDLMRKLHVFRAVVGVPTINLNSNPQLQKLYFGKLDYPAIRKTKSGWSTDEETLSKWAEAGLDIAQYHLDYREKESLRKTFITGVLLGLDEDGRLYSDLNQVGASSTGRISSRKYDKTILVPKHKKDRKTGEITTTYTSKKIKVGANLQNIPARSAEGARIRRAFIAEPGRKLVIADLAGAEWWMMAHWSKDAEMADQYHNKKDPHAVTAKFFFNLTESWQEIKDGAKAGDPVFKEYRNLGKCFHPDTEVLTRSGWKKITALADGEEVVQAILGDNYAVKLEWIIPLEVFTKHHTSKQLVHLKNEGVDIRVTPDHRMAVWGQTGKHKVVTPAEFGDARGWANAGMLSGGSRRVRSRILRLAVATQADGSYEGDRIRFGFTKERKIIRLRSLLKKNEYSIYTSKNGKNPDVTRIDLRPEISKAIRSLLDEDKTLPWWWLELPAVSRTLVLGECQFWDGTKDENWKMHRYDSSKRKNTDVVQAIAAITGRKSRLVVEGSMSKVSIRENNRSRGGNVKTTVRAFTKKVACLAVPSSFILVRDRGVPLIVGQTGNFGFLYQCRARRAAQLLGRKDKYERFVRADGRRGRRLVESAEQQGQQFLNRFFGLYKGVKQYHGSMIKFARDHGWVPTIAGRRAHLPFILSDIEGVREHAERQAVNAPIQGSIADIIKAAMNYFERSGFMRNRDAKALIQVHDELVFSVPEKHAEEVRVFVEKKMPLPYSDLMEVKLAAEAKVVNSWAEK